MEDETMRCEVSQRPLSQKTQSLKHGNLKPRWCRIYIGNQCFGLRHFVTRDEREYIKLNHKEVRQLLCLPLQQELSQQTTLQIV